jgi:predicted ester cyclase/L-ascorbate metabolism protein UlaG (beta-lactamase superfamily)
MILRSLPLAIGALALVASIAAAEPARAADGADTVVFQQIRNATIKLTYGGTTFLVDPLLGKKEAYPGFEGTYNSEKRWPLVDLPMPVEEVMKADAIIVTHTHLDHWDDAARASLPKGATIFTQNAADAATIAKDGFTDVRVMSDDTVFKGTHLHKIGGQHGTDQMMASPLGPLLGEAMGIVFERPGSATVYVAGDTIWNGTVEAAITRWKPDTIVLNTAYARVKGFEGAIIMGKEDLLRAYRLAPNAKVIGSHMDTVNHGMQTRKDLNDYIDETGMSRERVLVPADGETYQFTRNGQGATPAPAAKPRQTSVEQNKKLVRDFYAAIERGDYDAVAALCHPDFVFYPQMDLPVRGAAAFVASEKPKFEAFKGFKFTVERIVAEGDQVAAYIVFDANQTGDFPDIPSEGRHVRTSFMMLLRIADGKIIEKRAHYDRSDIRRQLLGQPLQH